MGIQGFRRNGRPLFAAIAVVLTLGVGFGFVANPAPSVAKTKKKTKPVATKVASVTTKPASAVATRFEVSSRFEAFEDTSRGTAKTTVSTATASRKLPTLVITPKDPQRKFPLFVFAHGLGGEPEAYRPLLEAIAARGYVVAAPTFPLSNAKSPGGPNFFDEPNQPADMSFVMTQMLKDSAVNSELVVVGGHSLGAITTIDLIANSCCFDKRVDAAVIVAGTANVFSGGKLFQGTAVPSLYIHGDKDATVDYSLGYSTWKTAQTPKWFMTVIGGDHSFGIAGKPELLQSTGALIVDTMVRFTDSRVATGSGSGTADDTTKALKGVVDANPKSLRLESITK